MSDHPRKKSHPYKKHRTVLNLLLICCFSPLSNATLNSANITASSISLSCINWKINGICYWLRCSPWGCRIRTSVRVSHYIPQVVVSSYLSQGGNPWKEMSLVSSSTGSLESIVTQAISGLKAGGGSNEQKFESKKKTNLQFFYADAIGHPATSLIGKSIPGYSCNSAVKPLFPYFLSALDSLSWRLGLVESIYPESLIPGRRELGSQINGNMWGNIYPRSGFVTQQDNYKAAAVVAQRVADIISRTGQPHSYITIKGGRRDGYWPPEHVVENTGTQNHKWQSLSPNLSRQCSVFPNHGTQAKNGNYAWALWQPYSCCKRRGQTFLYSMTF